jgi:hypothetical protein
VGGLSWWPLSIRVATMKLSNDWHDFKAGLKNYPRQAKEAAN